MPKNSDMTRVYFSHDQDTRSDDKILKMFFEFRKFVRTLERPQLEELAGISCYSIFWSVIEYMHRNSFLDKDIELLADTLRIEPEFVEKVLNDFNLFHYEQGEYISERVIKNITLQKEKSKNARKAVQTRWLLSFYDETYKKEFGITPVLDDEEIKNLMEYSDTIANFKQVLPDILYTLKYIKFDGKTKFEPKSNWLLKENNLARVYHGEFGELKHRKTSSEIRAEESAKKLEQEQLNQPSELELRIKSVSNKAEAIELITQNSKKTKALGIVILPQMKDLMTKFNISKKDIEEKLNDKI